MSTKELISGSDYKHKSGFVGCFSHVDKKTYTYYFKPVGHIPKGLKPKEGLVPLYKWDIDRNLEAIEY